MYLFLGFTNYKGWRVVWGSSIAFLGYQDPTLRVKVIWFKDEGLLDSLFGLIGPICPCLWKARPPPKLCRMPRLRKLSYGDLGVQIHDWSCWWPFVYPGVLAHKWLKRKRRNHSWFIYIALLTHHSWMHTWKKIPGCAVRCQPEAGTMEYEHSFVFHEPTVFKSHVCVCMMEAFWTYRMISGWKSSMCCTRRKCAAYMWGISTQPSVFLTQYQLITSVEAKAGEISVARVKSVLANYDQGGVVAQLVKSKRQGVMFWFAGYLKTCICVWHVIFICTHFLSYGGGVSGEKYMVPWWCK